MDQPPPAVLEFFNIALQRVDVAHRTQMELLSMTASQEIESRCRHIMTQADQVFAQYQQSWKSQEDQFQMEIQRLNDKVAELGHMNGLQAQQLQQQDTRRPPVSGPEKLDERVRILTQEKVELDRKVKDLETQQRKSHNEKLAILDRHAKTIMNITRETNDLEERDGQNKIRIRDLKEELAVEQLACKRSEEELKLRVADVDRLNKKISMGAKVSSRGSGQRTASLPAQSTAAAAAGAGAEALHNPKTRKRESQSQQQQSTSFASDNHETNLITPERKTFLSNTLKSLHDLDFEKFLAVQRLQTTVQDDDEDDDDDDNDDQSKPKPSTPAHNRPIRSNTLTAEIESIERKLCKDRYTTVADVEVDFKTVVDRCVLLKACREEERKRGLERFYAWRTKMGRLPSCEDRDLRGDESGGGGYGAAKRVRTK